MLPDIRQVSINRLYTGKAWENVHFAGETFALDNEIDISKYASDAAASVCYTREMAASMYEDLKSWHDKGIASKSIYNGLYQENSPSHIYNVICKDEHSYQFGWITASYELQPVIVGTEWKLSVTVGTRNYAHVRHALIAQDDEWFTQTVEYKVNTGEASEMIRAVEILHRQPVSPPGSRGGSRTTLTDLTAEEYDKKKKEYESQYVPDNLDHDLSYESDVLCWFEYYLSTYTTEVARRDYGSDTLLPYYFAMDRAWRVLLLLPLIKEAFKDALLRIAARDLDRFRYWLLASGHRDWIKHVVRLYSKSIEICPPHVVEHTPTPRKRDCFTCSGLV